MNNSIITATLAEFEAALQEFLANLPVITTKLQSALDYVLASGGKRLRPLIVILTGDMLNISRKTLYPLAIAIELVHTYSLIHDDLPAMDNDDLRRGLPSCHKQFDEATAILTGDGLQPLAVELLIQELTPQLPPITILEIIKELMHASGFNGMVAGQSLDLDAISGHPVDYQTLLQIHQLKTGKLIMAAVNMVTAIDPDQHRESLTTFAASFGIMYQMLDDYLDYYGKCYHGKGRNSDMANQKVTMASLFGKEELINIISLHREQILQCLTPFGENAKPLLCLIETTYKRIYN